jgi:hypothetical protein
MSDEPAIDEVAIARALRRLDQLVAEHPELQGPTGADNIPAWIAVMIDENEKGRTMPKEPTTQVAFRFADRLLERIDRHVKRLERAERGVEYTRADAVRDLVTRALDEIEASERKGRG